MPQPRKPADASAKPDERRLELGRRAHELGVSFDLEELSTDSLEGIVDEVEAALERGRAAAAAAPVPLITAIAAAMLDAGEVTKSSKNTEQGYMFASAEAILAAVRRPLLERGVLLTSQPVTYVEREITSRSGSKGTLYSLGVDFTFRDGAGAELVVTDWRGIGQDFGDKAIGKAYTNAIKTFVRTQWLLPTEHDDPESSPAGERVGDSAQAEPPAWAREATAERKALLLDALEPLIGREQGKALALAVKSSIGHVPDVLIPFARGIVRAFLDGTEDDVLARRRAARGREDADAARAAQDAAAEQPDEPAPESDVTPPTLNVEDARPAPPEEATLGAIRTATFDEVAALAENAADERVRKAAADELDQRRAEAIIAGEEPADDPPAPAAEGPDAPPAGTIDVGELPANPATAFGVLKAAGCICSDPLKQRSEAGTIDDACPIKGHGIPF